MKVIKLKWKKNKKKSQRKDKINVLKDNHLLFTEIGVWAYIYISPPPKPFTRSHIVMPVHKRAPELKHTYWTLHLSIYEYGMHARPAHTELSK